MFRWLLEPPPHVDAVVERQGMVEELAGRLDFRQDLEARLEALRAYDPTPFFEWCRRGKLDMVSPLWIWLARLSIPVMAGMTFACAMGWAPWPVWVLAVLASLALAMVKVRRIHPVLDELGQEAQVFGAFGKGFAHLASHDFRHPELRRLAGACADAGRELEKLDNLVSLADLRRNPVVYFPLLALTFWDIHLTERLQTWHGRCAERVDTWFAALQHVDALCGLAAMRHDQPGWAFPVFHERKAVEATALGHPLLGNEARVCNDVTLGHPQPCLLITGSNMSGKSTLLRAIGLNILLGQAGGPVCAEALALPVCRLGTSLRVTDSLEEGVSFFMAQLLRLKQVVEAARDLGHTPADAHPPRMVFLLDEILSGTNSAERQIAVRRIIGHLVDLGAVGAITTHDLELARQSNLRANSQAVHFREQFRDGEDGPMMTFDYQLRNGVSPTVNALKFLEIMGLDEERLKPR